MNTAVRSNSGAIHPAFLCLTAALAGAGVASFFAHKEKAALHTELNAMRSQLTQLKAEVPDAKEVEKLRAQVREAVELKKEIEEIHRLRGEVTGLRKDKVTFEQAKAENAQLRIAVQQAQKLQAENTALRGQVQSAVHNLQHVQALAVGQPGQAQKNACIANLKQIDGAIQQWALENRKVAASPVDWRGLLPYLKGNVLPVCPSSGVYLPGSSVSASPTCSVPGHTL